MTKGPVAARGRDLRALARIVTDDRGELPAQGLAPSLLSDLVQLIGCDWISIKHASCLPGRRGTEGA